jgi:hypothetical protein
MVPSWEFSIDDLLSLLVKALTQYLLAIFSRAAFVNEHPEFFVLGRQLFEQPDARSSATFDS